MTREEEDAEWMRLSKAGSKIAFHKLWERHHRNIEAYCIYLCNNREDGEDAALNVFVQAWLNRDQYRYPEAPKKWLFGIGKNECLQLKRRQAGRGQDVPLDAVEEIPAPDAFGDPSAVVLNNPLPELVAGLEKQLTTEEMLVFIRTFEQGWKGKEVADELERNGSTMRSIIARVKHKAKKVMKAMGYHETQEEARDEYSYTIR